MNCGGAMKKHQQMKCQHQCSTANYKPFIFLYKMGTIFYIKWVQFFILTNFKTFYGGDAAENDDFQRRKQRLQGSIF